MKMKMKIDLRKFALAEYRKARNTEKKGAVQQRGKDAMGALAKHDGTDGERTIPVRAEQLRKGDKIFDHTYGYVVIESVRPFDPKYKNSLLVETSRGRRDFGPPDRILHVLRNS